MKLSRIWLAGAALILAASASFAQGRPGGRGGFGNFGLLGISSIPAVQMELKLDAAQVDLLKQLSAEVRQKAEANRPDRASFQNLSPEERTKRFAELRAQAEKTQAENDKKVAEILDAKQMARLKQLELQRMGLRALTRKDVQTALKLTPEQQTRIKAATDAQTDAFRAAFQGGQNMSQDERRAAFTKIQTDTDAKLDAVLTADQKKQLEAMKGAAFKFPERGQQ